MEHGPALRLLLWFSAMPATDTGCSPFNGCRTASVPADRFHQAATAKKKALNAMSSKPLKVWVLAPHLVTNDANIDYYYDFSQSIAEYTATFHTLNLNWQWQPVTMNDYADIIEKIYEESKNGTLPVVLNLCDGDEVNG